MFFLAYGTLREQKLQILTNTFPVETAIYRVSPRFSSSVGRRSTEGAI
ncbi:hypothetical protein [Nostoc sp.]